MNHHQTVDHETQYTRLKLNNEFKWTLDHGYWWSLKLLHFVAYAILFEILINHENFYRYFAVPYFLPKLDMVAIPDFAFGAMANYGLVTCCETDLLYDNQYSTAPNKQRVICMQWMLLFFLLEFRLANIVWNYCFNSTTQIV